MLYYVGKVILFGKKGFYGAAISKGQIHQHRQGWRKGELFGIQPGDQLLLMADKKRGIALIDENSISVPERLWETAREADNDDPEG